MRKAILACVVVALIVGSTSATAATLITGKQIKNGSITGQDIKKGSINAARLSDGLQSKIDDVGARGPAGAAGSKGDTGAAGAKGDKGAKGDDGQKGDKGVVNVIYDGGAFASNTPAAVDGDPTLGNYKGGTFIRDLVLPAGNYEIEASLSVRGADNASEVGFTRVRCNLVNSTPAGGVSLDTFYQDFFRADEPSPGFREGLHIGALVELDTESTVVVKCGTVHGTSAGKIASAKLVATEVAKLTKQL